MTYNYSFHTAKCTCICYANITVGVLLVDVIRIRSISSTNIKASHVLDWGIDGGFLSLRIHVSFLGIPKRYYLPIYQSLPVGSLYFILTTRMATATGSYFTCLNIPNTVISNCTSLMGSWGPPCNLSYNQRVSRLATFQPMFTTVSTKTMFCLQGYPSDLQLLLPHC